MVIEMIQTTKASFPVVPAMPPIENRTSGGTPAATQKAPFQLSDRTIWPEPFSVVIPSLLLNLTDGSTAGAPWAPPALLPHFD